MTANASLAQQALACLDLTSLNDADTESDIERLCERAAGAWGPVAAVCVWPRLAAVARRSVPAGVAVAAVANFPAGAVDVEAAVRETGQIVQAGADEVDLVLPWRALAAGQGVEAARLVRAVRRACEGLRLKLILESGELARKPLVAEASRLGIAEGADFLKTSTGKTPHGATAEAAEVMLKAIAADAAAGTRVGFKASGGVRTVDDAAVYIGLVERILGPQAVTPQRFRIGASSLLSDIEAVLGGQAGASAPGSSY